MVPMRVSRFAVFLCVGLLGALSFPARAADRAKVAFDIPASFADAALKRLAEQSGREVLFPPSAVDGVRTRAVKGRMTPLEALQTMLAGTPLVGVQDEKSGALTVRRNKPADVSEGKPVGRPSALPMEFERSADTDI